MQISRRPNRFFGFGMVDAVVGILILATISLAMSTTFMTIARLDDAQSQRIETLYQEADLASLASWF